MRVLFVSGNGYSVVPYEHSLHGKMPFDFLYWRNPDLLVACNTISRTFVYHFYQYAHGYRNCRAQDDIVAGGTSWRGRVTEWRDANDNVGMEDSVVRATIIAALGYDQQP